MALIIETPRLLIRELLPSDDVAMFEMDRDAEVHRYLGNNPYTSIEQSRNNIRYIRQQYEENGIGRWAVVIKETGAFVGWTGWKLMKETVHGHSNHLDFGYRHTREHWGKGYGYEAAKASFDYGRKVLGFKDAYAMTHVDNAGSRHILEKLGFVLKDIFPYDGPTLWTKDLPVTWYEYLL